MSPTNTRQFSVDQVKELMAELEVPFDPAVIDWLVPNTTKSGKLRGQVIPYADPRTYTDRLNSLFTSAGWTRKYTVHSSANFQRNPKVDEDLLEQERSYHSLDSPLPAILLYFRPCDAVTACFDNECEFWGQETPEPNLIVPLRPGDPNSVRRALQAIQVLMGSGTRDRDQEGD